MKENWISQVVSSLGTMYNKSIDSVCHGKLWIKSWYNSKNSSVNVADFSYMTLSDSNCAYTYISKFIDTLRSKCVGFSGKQYV